MQVAVIVLNFNNPIATIRCLNSLKLLKRGKTKFTVMVVDNGSTDNSLSQIQLNFTDIILIKSPNNLGYAGGNNLGIKKALADKSTHVLLLNNDTQVIDELMLDKLLEPGADLSAPVIKFHRQGLPWIDYGGRVDWLMGRNTHLEYRFGEEPTVIENADYLSGTCLLVKNEVFKKVGLLDAKYFLYYEDVDFCLRSKKAGLTLAVSKNTAIYHELSASSNKLGRQKIIILSQSHRRFILRHLSPLVWPLALMFNLYLSQKES